MSWGAVLQGGQPITLSCPSGTGNGTGCYDIVVPGQDVKRGMHIDSNGQPSFLGNPAAFTQPCVWRSTGPDTSSVPGCIPIDGGLGLLGGSPTQIAGPPFKRLDFSTFKDFQLSERFRLQFRRSSSTFSTTRTSTLPDSAATAFNRFRVRAISPVRTLAKWDPLAMLPTIRDRSSLL